MLYAVCSSSAHSRLTITFSVPKCSSIAITGMTVLEQVCYRYINSYYIFMTCSDNYIYVDHTRNNSQSYVKSSVKLNFLFLSLSETSGLFALF